MDDVINAYAGRSRSRPSSALPLRRGSPSAPSPKPLRHAPPPRSSGASRVASSPSARKPKPRKLRSPGHKKTQWQQERAEHLEERALQDDESTEGAGAEDPGAEGPGEQPVWSEEEVLTDARAAAIQKLSTALLANLDQQSIVEHLQGCVREAMSVGWVRVWVTQEYDELSPPKTLLLATVPPELVGLVPEAMTVTIADGCVLGTVGSTRSALNLRDAGMDSRHDPRVDQAMGTSTKSLVVVPIEEEGTLLGVLAVGNKEHRQEMAEFDLEDTSMLQVLAGLAGAAMKAARCIKAQLVTQSAAQSLMDAMLVLSTEPADLQQCLLTLMRLIRHVLKVRDVLLFLPESGSPRTLVKWQQVGELAKPSRVDAARGVAWTVFSTAVAVCEPAGFTHVHYDASVDRVLGGVSGPLLSVPLLDHPGVAGVLQVVGGADRPGFDEVDQRLLCDIARVAAPVIRSTRHKEALATLRTQVKGQMSAAGVLWGQCSVRDTARALLEQALGLVHAVQGAVWLEEDSSGVLSRVSTMPAVPQSILEGEPESLRVGQGVVGLCAQRGDSFNSWTQSLLREHAQEPAGRGMPQPPPALHPLGSNMRKCNERILVVPIQSPGGAVAGVLEVRGGSQFDFSSTQVQLLHGLGELAGDAFRKAREHDQARASQDKLITVMGQCTMAAHHSNSFEDVVTQCFPVSQALLAADKLLFYRVDQGSGMLWAAQTSLLAEEGQRVTRAVRYAEQTKGLAALAAQRCETVLCNDVHSSAAFCSEHDAEHGYDTRSSLCVPLLTRSQPGVLLGVAEFLNKRGGGPWSCQEQALAEELMAHVAGCMAGALRAQGLREAQARLDSVCRAMHTLLPVKLAQVKEPQMLFAQALQELPVLLGGDRAALILVNPERGLQWELESAQLLPGKLPRGVHRVFGGDFVAEMAVSMQAVHMAVAADSEQFEASTDELPNYKTLSIAGVPVRGLFGEEDPWVLVLLVRKKRDPELHEQELRPLGPWECGLLGMYGQLVLLGAQESQRCCPAAWRALQLELTSNRDEHLPEY